MAATNVITTDENEPIYVGTDLWDAICGGMPVPYEPSAEYLEVANRG